MIGRKTFLFLEGLVFAAILYTLSVLVGVPLLIASRWKGEN